MSIVRSSASFNSSAASSHVTSVDDMDTAKVKSYVKDLLKSRIFLGRYLERRLSNQRIGYRDIVLLSAAEVDLKKDLLEAQYKLRSQYPNIHWIGITDAESLGYPSGVCLWTEIDNQPFGPFWFQIRSIKFRDEEVILILKCIRHISDSFLELEPILSGTVKKSNISNNQQPNSTASGSTASFNDTYAEIIETLKGALTISNVKEFFTFLFAFVIALFTGSTAFINFLGNFILALVREMSIFVKNSTPMFLGFLDFLSKIVGGFYILLAMFFRPSNPVPQNRRAVTYYDRPTTGNGPVYNRRGSSSCDDRGFD